MTTVLTAVTSRHETTLVGVLGRASGIVLVRRCADLAELLSAGAAGVARVAVVSPDLRGLDRDALRHLAGHGVRVAGFVPSDDEDGERRLRQLGVATMLRPDQDPAEVAALLHGLAEASTSQPLSLAEEAEPEEPEPDVPAPVTAVWGPTGAPGRSTVAVTLAALLARAGVRTMLVDLDTWGASVAQLLGLVDEASGVAAAARASEQGGLDVPSLARLAPEALPGLRVLTGLPRADRWPELRSAAVEDMLRLARSVVDHVVVDTGFALEDDEELSYDTAAPRRNAATLAALEAADRLVVVGAADPVSLQRLVRGVQEVSLVGVPRPVVAVNKVRPSVAGARPERAIRDVLARFAGLEDVRLLPWVPDDCDAALLAGRSLPEVRPRSPLVAALASLAAELEPRCAPAPAGSRHGRRRRVAV